jgi:hypothetical protein
MLRVAAILVSAVAVLPLGAQPANFCGGDRSSLPNMAPPASAGKPVEMTGVVGQIHIVAGQGMPCFELKRGAETTRVYLGPMPFLIAENFNPKAGQEVAVTGYKVQDGVLASQVTFVAEKRTVKFRDEKGWPVWRGGFGRGAGRRW